MAAFSLQQKTFVFSMIANAAANLQNAKTPDLEKAVVDRFNTVTAEQTQFLGTGWTLVWGPVVREEASSGVADNTLMVVRGTDGGKPVYIVAIAGTNAVSAFDIFTEDLKVHDRFAFGNTGALISQGTQVGLNILESLTFKSQTVQQYLTGVRGRNATLIFTGHSLGGALAPTLALDLAVNRGFDLTKWAAVHVYPTAGPTPGDAKFVSLFTKTFPAGGGWNQNVINSIDVVPRAWTRLNTILDAFGDDLEGSGCIKTLVTFLQSKIVFQRMPYADLPEAPFTGQFNASLRPESHPDDLSVRFAVQAFYQHIPAYSVALIPELSSVFTGGSLPKSSTDAIYNKCHPVKE